MASALDINTSAGF